MALYLGNKKVAPTNIITKEVVSMKAYFESGGKCGVSGGDNHLTPTINPDDTANLTSFREFFRYSSFFKAPKLNTAKATSFEYLFSNCVYLREVPIYDSSNVTNMSNMFAKCASLDTLSTPTFSNGFYNMKNVTDASYLFYNSNLKYVPDLSTASKLENIEYMLTDTKITEVPLFDTSHVTRASNFLSRNIKLITVPKFNFSEASTAASMFSNCQVLESIPNLEFPKAKSLDQMFYGCKKLKNVSITASSNLTDIQSMFYECNALETVTAFNTSSVIQANFLFYNCKLLKVIPAFNFSTCIAFGQTFRGCSALEEFHATGMKVAFDISSSTKFTREALVEILTNLGTPKSSQTLTMGATNLAKLTDVDKKIATDKNWTLA